MASISIVSIYEDNAQNVIGIVYEQKTSEQGVTYVEAVNAVQNLGAQQPIPHAALVEAARKGFPFAPEYDSKAFGNRTLPQLESALQLYDHHIADIWPTQPTALYPEKATPAGLQFLIRWCF